MAKWRNAAAADALLGQINQVLTVSPKNAQGKEGFALLEHALLLASLVQISPQICQVDLRHLALRTLMALPDGCTVDSATIIRELSKVESAFLKQPRQSYRFVSVVSVAPTVSLPRQRIQDTGISFMGSLTGKLSSSRRSAISEFAPNGTLADNPRHQFVLARVHARTPAEAAEYGLDAIDTVRGIWNLSLNRSTLMRLSTGHLRPINQLLLGPAHTVHDSSGTLAGKSLWYEADYTHERQTFSNAAKMNRALKYSAAVRKKLNASKYTSDMYAVLRRYSHALDCVDLGKAFLQLWGLLEQLTATQSMSYDITIRRASFVFIEQPYARLRLSVLRDFRNASVHSGEEQADIEAQVFLLKQHVERLLEFHIAHCDRYASIVEAAEFLDNPTSRAAIDQRIEKLKLARRYVVNA